MDTVAIPLALFRPDAMKTILMVRHGITENEALLAMALAAQHAPQMVEDPELGITLRWCRVCQMYNYGPEQEDACVS